MQTVFGRYYLNNSNIYISTHKCAMGDDFLHNHDFFEVFYITKGSISHTVNNKTNVITEGDIFLLRPKDVHIFNREKGNDCEHRDVLISVKRFKNACDSLNGSLYDYVCSLPLPPHCYIPHYALDELEETCVLFASNNALDKKLNLDNYIISELVNLFFKELFLKNYSYPDWITNLIKKIENPANYVMDLSELLSDLRYNRTHISRAFKNYTNTTIVTYSLKCRLNYALHLLNSPDYNITEIAQKTGFYSITYFNRKFKEYFGKSPSAIRKESLLPPLK